MKAGAPSPGGKTISLLTATCIVVANMVGTGVFTSLGFQVGDLPSGFTLLALWLVGGICALCGALCYGELAAALPRSGGEYHFLGTIYHPALGFLAGWVSATVGFAAPIALAAMAFGKYAAGAAPGASPLVLSLVLAVLIALVHLRGVEFGARFQTAATVFKITLILLFIGAGIFASHPQPLTFLPTSCDPALIGSAPFAVSLVYVMYAYSGWNASTYIVGEIRDPARNVPRSVALGTLLVAALYLALNAVFLRVAPLSALAGQLDVAHVAGTFLFGENGGRVAAGLISIGLVASVSAMTWIGPRVAATMGEDYPPFRLLARRTAGGVPLTASLFQLAIVLALLLTRSFQRVIDYTLFSLTLCSLLTVAGVLVLRIRRPDLPRPYRTWGYPITPALFCAISLWMLAHMLLEKASRDASLSGLVSMAVGLLVYFSTRESAA